jgi:hypothetical protein
MKIRVALFVAPLCVGAPAAFSSYFPARDHADRYDKLTTIERAIESLENIGGIWPR